MMRTSLVALLLAGCATLTGAETLVVKAERMIDGRGGRPLTPAMVRVEGDRIVERVGFVMKGGVVYRDDLTRR